MQLAQRLVKKGVLSAQDLPRLAEEHAAAPNKPLHQLLIEKGFAKEEDVLPVLADALMDAGCDDDCILGHCRNAEVHCRGCWVVDRLLGLG